MLKNNKIRGATGYERNEAEFVRALLADRDSGCLQEHLLAVQVASRLSHSSFLPHELLPS
jgi:hypothetical protein